MVFSLLLPLVFTEHQHRLIVIARRTRTRNGHKESQRHHPSPFYSSPEVQGRRTSLAIVRCVSLKCFVTSL